MSFTTTIFICYIFFSSFSFFFFFNDTATTEIYTLSLHDALPISDEGPGAVLEFEQLGGKGEVHRVDRKSTRLNSSHTVISYAVFCLKKKKKKNTSIFLNNKKKIIKISKSINCLYFLYLYLLYLFIFFFYTIFTFFSFFFFFFNDTATTEIYTLSLHDALPISSPRAASCRGRSAARRATECGARSEEHTSELQSHSDLVCRLLLEKKKKLMNRECQSRTYIRLLLYRNDKCHST